LLQHPDVITMSSDFGVMIEAQGKICDLMRLLQSIQVIDKWRCWSYISLLKRRDTQKYRACGVHDISIQAEKIVKVEGEHYWRTGCMRLYPMPAVMKSNVKKSLCCSREVIGVSHLLCELWLLGPDKNNYYSRATMLASRKVNQVFCHIFMLLIWNPSIFISHQYNHHAIINPLFGPPKTISINDPTPPRKSRQNPP
jgi:hypothetical protein